MQKINYLFDWEISCWIWLIVGGKNWLSDPTIILTASMTIDAIPGLAVEPASIVALTVSRNLSIAWTVFLKFTAMKLAVNESNPVPALNNICATCELAFLKMQYVLQNKAVVQISMTGSAIANASSNQPKSGIDQIAIVIAVVILTEFKATKELLLFSGKLLFERLTFL